ncbi:YicC/YloC family endoribonuclease [Rhodovulum sulfidophilum]|uniref:YicC/YloC family endoribonuclease n=1 Tax=Rhodovulum sulfidophilum TaxID=35806 RepID=UPI000951CA87|nr:YicC/YloC family endoribonuclease [Rhodovulum sulfidophilum]MBL3551315.1 YicC family protein [Rhodovulum sulfidophilum]OLS48644.1 YicC family protein [Rhodovulum sulfidophilum]
MLQSMTAFAARSGQTETHAWTWELRGVNSKGLDLRLRLPDWVPGLEPVVRAAVQSRVARGSVTLGLRISARDSGHGGLQIDPVALRSVLAMLGRVEAEAAAQGLSLAPSSAVEILALRGLADSAAPETETAPLLAALSADLTPLLEEFMAMRASEGAALATVLCDHLATISTLTSRAAEVAEARRDQIEETLRASLVRVMETAAGVDPDRVAQELALIAVKADVTEELDRLRAHVAAAETLLASGEPVGRRLDFLMQEFNREANTLCSKAQSTGLTRVGLDLKATIDQMREQVQNVE